MIWQCSVRQRGRSLDRAAATGRRFAIIVSLFAVGTSSAVAAWPNEIKFTRDLPGRAGSPGDAVAVRNHTRMGDGGGGVFVFDASAGTVADGGRVFAATNGWWVRMDAGPVRAAWFGVPVFRAGDTPSEEDVRESTWRLQAALDAAEGGMLTLGPGDYHVSDTLLLPGGTRMEGAGNDGADATRIVTSGSGAPRRWTDTGQAELDTFSALVAVCGQGSRVRKLSLCTDGRWDVGIVVPSSKRNAFEHLTVNGDWGLAACLLDATWSERHTDMIGHHRNLIAPTSLNEITLLNCDLSGRWGLMVRGAIGRRVDDYPKRQWLWSGGGTSDLTVAYCRLEGRTTPGAATDDGGAYYHDAPVTNSRQAGQGHRFVSCELRSNAKYMVRLGASHRDRFFSCRFVGSPYTDPNGTQRVPVMRNERSARWTSTFAACEFNAAVDKRTSWDFNNTSVWRRKGRSEPMWESPFVDRLGDQ